MPGDSASFRRHDPDLSTRSAHAQAQTPSSVVDSSTPNRSSAEVCVNARCLPILTSARVASISFSVASAHRLSLCAFGGMFGISVGLRGRARARTRPRSRSGLAICFGVTAHVPSVAAAIVLETSCRIEARGIMHPGGGGGLASDTDRSQDRCAPTLRAALLAFTSSAPKACLHCCRELLRSICARKFPAQHWLAWGR